MRLETQKVSAGLLLYRSHGSTVEVLLAHPGGPFWMRKDDGAWSIPKGLVEPGEEELAAARREFNEETGFVAGGVGSERDLVKVMRGQRPILAKFFEDPA